MYSYAYGLKRGIPIGLGYLAVSFAFGVAAVNGLAPLTAIIISLTNLTSAGQFAGVEMMARTASYFEIGLAVLLINLRYSLMSLSLSQKIDPSIPTYKRLLFGFGITDEVYAVAISEENKLSAKYMFGLITLPIVGWTLGTALGAYGAGLMNEKLLSACSIALYAMFIAIIIPDARKKLSVLIVILIAVALSCIFYYVPYIKEIGLGFKIIISTILASVIGALIFPIKDENNIKLKEEENV